MDTRFIESLITVIDVGSIAAAAREQNLTPAAINQRIKALEHELGTQLIQRAGKTVRPTEVCINLVPQLRSLLHSADAMKAKIGDRTLKGILRVGAVATMMAYCIPDTVVAMRESARNVDIELIPGRSTELYELLLKGTLDLALIVDPPFEIPKSLTAKLLAREKLMLVTNEPHNGNEREILESQPYIRYDLHAWGGRHANNYLQAHNISPSIFCTMDDPDTTCRMIAKGLGVSLLPGWFGATKNFSHLHWHPIESGHKFSRQVLALQPATPAKQNISNHFLEIIRAQMAKP